MAHGDWRGVGFLGGQLNRSGYSFLLTDPAEQGGFSGENCFPQPEDGEGALRDGMIDRATGYADESSNGISSFQDVRR